MNTHNRFNHKDEIVFKAFKLIDPYDIATKVIDQEFLERYLEILKKVEEGILDYVKETMKKKPFEDFVDELKKTLDNKLSIDKYIQAIEDTLRFKKYLPKDLEGDLDKCRSSNNHYI